MSKVFSLVYLCGIFSFVFSTEAFQNLNKEANACETACTVEPLAYKNEFLNACKRGCRLYGVCEWATFDLLEARESCKSACNESYFGNDESKAACNAGCEAAYPLAEKRHKKLTDHEIAMRTYSNSMPSLFGMRAPFSEFSKSDEGSFSFGLDNLMNEMMASALTSFNQFMSSSSRHVEIFDIREGDTEKVIIVEYVDPVVNSSFPADKKVMLNTGINGYRTTLREDLESNLQTNVNKKHIFESLQDRLGNGASPSYSCWRKMKSHAQEWWSCMVRKAGLPELVLFLFWVSLSLILLMTCLVQFRPSPKLSVNGDLAYITDSKGNLPSYLEPYPTPEGAKKSPYFLASVVVDPSEKVALERST